MHELSKRDASDDQYTRKAYANNIQHKYKLKWMIFCAICKFDKYVRLLSLMVTPKSNVCLSVSVSHGFFCRYGHQSLMSRLSQMARLLKNHHATFVTSRHDDPIGYAVAINSKPTTKHEVGYKKKNDKRWQIDDDGKVFAMDDCYFPKPRVSDHIRYIWRKDRNISKTLDSGRLITSSLRTEILLLS